MNVKREEMKKNLKQTEEALRDLVFGDNRMMQVNVAYGMLGEKKFTLLLTKQMTLDAYVDNNESSAITSFPVLDVTVNRRAFLSDKDKRYVSPLALAVMIHKAARKLQHYEIQ